MLMGKSKLFTDDELSRIEQAVKQAETGISGEIVPVFVGRSDGYEQGNLRAGIAFGTIASLSWMAVYEYSNNWSGHWFYTPEAFGMLTILAFAVGYFAAMFIPLFRLIFILKSELAEAVDMATKLAFLKEEVFKTKNRTGILIFISHLEHRVQIMGDAGISAKVSKDEWNHILDTIIKGLKSNQKTEGICKAVDESKQLLLKYGFVAEADDTDELSNNLRIEP